MTESPEQAAGSVAVLGCGNMGAAIVRALLTAGTQVLAWNRTHERALALESAGARACPSTTGAVRDAQVVIICVGSTDDVRSVLESVEESSLAGRLLLNVTTGTPQDADALQGWARERGVAYLDAAIGAYPEQIGSAEARLLVAGDEDLWLRARPIVLTLGGASIFVGPNPGAANVIDAAMTGAFFITSLVSFIEATRYMQQARVSPDLLSDQVEYSTEVLKYQMQQIVGRIRSGTFSTNEASLNVYADAAQAFSAGMSQVVDASMVTATATVLRRAVDAGLGELDMAAMVNLEREPAS